MAMVTLFPYARGKNYLPRGEQTEAEFVTRYDDKREGVIGIYTLKEFATLLKYVDPRFLLFVALGGFAGQEEAKEWFALAPVKVKRPK